MFSFYEKKTHTVEIKETTHLTSWTIDDEIQLNQFNLQIDELRQKLEIEDGKASEHIEDFEEFIGLKEQIRVLEIKLKKMTHSILEEYLDESDPNISESAIEGDSDWLICPKCNDAWESNSLKAMVICPKCDRAFHNPRK